MALLENIAEFLEDNEIGTRGTDIFIGFLGDDGTIDNAVMIDQTGGVQPDRDLPISKPTVQIMVRDKDYTAGLSKLQTIFNLLHGAHDNLVLAAGGVDIMRIYAMNEPQHVERDEEERDIFTCTFVFQLRK